MSFVVDRTLRVPSYYKRHKAVRPISAAKGSIINSKRLRSPALSQLRVRNVIGQSSSLRLRIRTLRLLHGKKPLGGTAMKSLKSV